MFNFIGSFLNKFDRIRDFSIYFFTSFLMSALGFFLIPVFTQHMTTYEMGIYGTFVAINVFLLNLFIFGTNTIFISRYYKIDRVQREALLSNIIYFISILWSVVFGVSLIFVDRIAALLDIQPTMLVIALIANYFNSIYANFLSLFQISRRPLIYAVSGLSVSILTLGLSCLFVIYCEWSLYGRLFGTAIPLLIVPFIVFFSHRNSLQQLDWVLIKFILRKGYSFLIAGIAGFLIHMGTRIFINKLSSGGVSSTGIFTVGNQFAMFIKILNDSFSRAWMSFFYENVGNNKSVLIKYQLSYLVVLSIVTLLFNFIMKFVFSRFVAESYQNGYEIMVILTIAFFFDAVSTLSNGYLIFLEKFSTLRNIAIFQAAVSAALNVMLIETLDTVGAAYSMLISFFVGMLLSVYFVYKAYPTLTESGQKLADSKVSKESKLE
jgi:O-antigen/teichoic acid export membrane protein